MARFNKTLKTIMEAMSTSSKEKTKAYDTPATVLRVDGDTLWVHIDGGVDETPIKRTINAKVGDVVQVRVGGGRAWATGNATAPPTDDTKAGIALEQTNAVSKTVKTVKTLVDKVTKIAGDTAQYFWHTQQGTDTGVHITEIPKEDFLADPENGGGNLLARSNGIAVRDGLTELATFGAEGIGIGFSSGNHVAIDSESIDIGDGRGLGSTFLRMIKKGIQLKAKPDISTGSVTTPFEVSYRFRDISEVRDYVGMSVTTTSQTYTLRYTPRSDIVVRIATNIAEIYKSTTFSYGTAETKTVSYRTGVTDYKNIIAYDGDDTFTYSTDTNGGFFYDVAYETGTGNAYSGATMSLGTHEGVTVYKKGRETTRLGRGLIAESDYQTVTGKYNDNKSTNLFEVGNGTASNRSNAFEVDASGNATFAGNVTASNIPTIESATIVSGIGTVNPGAIVDLTVTFTKTFSTAPVVTATFVTSAVPYTADFGNLQLSIYSVSTTGCVIRIYNAGGTAVTPGINYIAMS